MVYSTPSIGGMGIITGAGLRLSQEQLIWPMKAIYNQGLYLAMASTGLARALRAILSLPIQKRTLLSLLPMIMASSILKM